MLNEKDKAEIEQAVQEAVTDVVGTNEIWFTYDRIEDDTVLIHVGIKKLAK